MVRNGDLQKLSLNDLGDEYCAFRFVATMQLRTPLSVLIWHDFLYTTRDEPPPVVAKEGWEGLWLATMEPITIGCVTLPLFGGTHASDIGSVDGSLYASFLLAIRQVADAFDLPAELRKRLIIARLTRAGNPWEDYVTKHGGASIIADQVLA